MNKNLLPLVIIAAFFSVSHAQQETALEQLIGPSDVSVSPPLAPLPKKTNDILASVYNSWDPAAPFSYDQNPALILPGDPGETFLNNVRSGPTPADHKSYTWETIRIKSALIEKAVFGYRTYGTGHSFLVFTFKPGGAVNARGENIQALTFGAEGWSREPYGYTLSHAMKGRYPLIWVATTFESYSDYIAGAKKRDTFLKNMNIGPVETSRLFSLLLARIDETNRNKETYNLFTNSCTNNPVNLINQVIPEGQRISLKAGGLMNPSAAIPKYAVKKYTANGTLQAGTFRMGPDNYEQFDITKI